MTRQTQSYPELKRLLKEGDPHEDHSQAERDAAWLRARKRHKVAPGIAAVGKRLELRGMSISSAEPAHNFMAAVNVAVIAAAISLYAIFDHAVPQVITLLSIIVAIRGLQYLVRGMRYEDRHLKPTFRTDEMVTTLRSTPQEMAEELFNRSNDQRRRLWQLRISQAINSVLLERYALPLLAVAAVMEIVLQGIDAF